MEEIQLNLVLIGKTGQGKSETGNTLLDRPGFFPKSTSMTLKTRNVKFSCRTFQQYLLHVVDGPSIEDNDMDTIEDKKTAMKHMETALAMCFGGVDAFLYVIRFGDNFTEENRSTLDSIFGDGFFKHVIIVVTYGDSFQREMEPRSISFNDWCRTQQGPFQKFFQDCDRRAVLFNNIENDDSKRLEQIQEIIDHAHNLQEKNGRYTSQCFQLAEQARERMIIELKVPQLKIEIQEKVTLLAAELEKFSESSSESQKESIRARIKTLRDEIKLQDRGCGLLNEMEKLVDQVEENLYDRITSIVLEKVFDKLRFQTTICIIAGLLVTAAGVFCLNDNPRVGVHVASLGVVTCGACYLHRKNIENVIRQQDSELKHKTASNT